MRLFSGKITPLSEEIVKALVDNNDIESAARHEWLSWTKMADVEDAIRLAVSLGGDADTQAAIAGGIAEAFYGRVTEVIVLTVRDRLPPRFIEVIESFRQAFPLNFER